MSDTATPETPALSPESLNPNPAPEAQNDFFAGIEKHFEADPTPADPAPTETPTETSTPDPKPADPAPTKVVSPKAKDFELIKTQREEARAEALKHSTRVTELETQLKAFDGEKAQLKELQDKVAQYEKEISAVRLEASPEYEKVIMEPSNKIKNEATRLAQKYKIDTSKLIEALSESDPSKQSDLSSELATSMNNRDQMLLYTLVDDFNALVAKRQELHSNADEAWKEVQSNRDKEATQAKEKSVRAWRESGEKIWQAIESKVPLKDLPNLAALKTEVAAKPLSELPLDQQTYSLASGHLLPHFVKQVAALQKQNAELQETVAKYAKASPAAGGGSAPAKASPGTSDYSSGGFLASLEEQLARG